MLAEGTLAPPFTLKDHLGNIVSLEQFRGKHEVVLIFYPGDLTPGCTKQLCTVRDDYSKYKEKGVMVYGVNPAGKESHTKFAQKHAFPFPLLIDEGSVVAEAYDCKGMIATKRTVYVVDKNGVIAFAREGKPSTEEILSSIE